ncbi:MAG: bifunctional glycosyltransferase family 2/GtrA family protein [Bacilli bacterium]|nr:bifunctional glycosyltransferase family 2/GtrA family protein [Bacilli bacterium]
MKKKIDNYIILIPAYNPSSKLLELVNDLKKYNFKILIINDGSIESKKIFKELKNNSSCTILEYEENMGKGYALKYGFKYYLDNLVNDYQGIITTDADYQHLPKDIYKIREVMNDDTIILGSRDFYKKEVPFPNRLGNRITSTVFKLLYGRKIFDTQTGLRGIPNKYLDICLEIPGNRFEYEMEQLIYFTNHNINIKEIPIETIYYTKSESKFKKGIDSMKIYKVILKESFRFLVTSLLSAFLDIILFTIFIYTFQSLGDISIFVATFMARIIADFLNFNLTKYFVFDSNEDFKKILSKYYILSFGKMAMSAILVFLINKLIPFNKTFIKVIVDTLIYFLSYRIQKKYIFKTIE